MQGGEALTRERNAPTRACSIVFVGSRETWHWTVSFSLYNPDFEPRTLAKLLHSGDRNS